MTDQSAEFIAISEAALVVAARQSELDEGPLVALEEAATEVGLSWSKSNLGYQANVYYKGFQAPPPGATFSREWGFLGMFHGTVGDWQELDPVEVTRLIERKAGEPDLPPLRVIADAARTDLEALIHRARSLAARIALPHDDYLAKCLEELQHVSVPSLETVARALMNVSGGQFAVRDMRAAEAGWQVAPHQAAMANALHIRSPYLVAKALAEVCERIGRHLEAIEPGVGAAVVQLGSKIFIGHGGASKEYLALGTWLGDLGFDWDVFDRKPTAGLSTKERLSTMLDDAQMAFLMMTPEDETAQGTMNARANVIHEVGLFQGRLGWTKAIALLEEGCEEFSNIVGVGQIRYPKGNVRAAFEEIR